MAVKALEKLTAGTFDELSRPGENFFHFALLVRTREWVEKSDVCASA